MCLQCAIGVKSIHRTHLHKKKKSQCTIFREKLNLTLSDRRNAFPSELLKLSN